MNKSVKKLQQEYRERRELSNYSILDIEGILKTLAEKGFVWVIKDMEDICDAEKIIAKYYLSVYRANQTYDNLDELFNFEPSIKQSESTSHTQSSLNTIPVQKKRLGKKQQYRLEVRDVKQFYGYKKAKELERKIVGLCKEFPSFEGRHIVDQIVRSASSIKERIETGEQIYVGEKYNQYSIAIGSAKETSAWLQISLGQKYITKNQFDELDSLANQVISILTKNLSNIKKKSEKNMKLPSPYTPNVKNFGAYNNALLLVEKIYDITREPGYWNERDLVKKMRKCATSCVANIAEAHQLYILKKFSFFNEALQALNGLDSHLDMSLVKGAISEEVFKEIYELRVSIRNMLSTKMANMSKEKAS